MTDGAAAIRNNALKLFSRTDGEAVDWALMAESLLKVAFDFLDRVQDDTRRAALLRRIEGGTYDRLAKNEPDPWRDTAPDAPAPQGGTFAPRFEGPDLARGPRPPSNRRGKA